MKPTIPALPSLETKLQEDRLDTATKVPFRVRLQPELREWILDRANVTGFDESEITRALLRIAMTFVDAQDLRGES